VERHDCRLLRAWVTHFSTDPASVETRLLATPRVGDALLHRPCVGGDTTAGYSARGGVIA